MAVRPVHLTLHAGGRTSARRYVVVLALVLSAVLHTAAPAAAQDAPAIAVNGTDGSYVVDAAFTVPQAARFVLAALTDYADIPRYMPEIKSSSVIERSDDRIVVEQEAVARFLMFKKKVHLVLDVEEQGNTIRFRDRCGKSFARYEGAWTVIERDGRTAVAYRLEARPSFDVPDFLLKRLLKRDADQMIERLKVEIGARARTAR